MFGASRCASQLIAVMPPHSWLYRILNAQQRSNTTPRVHGDSMQHLRAAGVQSHSEPKKEDLMIRTNIATLGLIAAAGVAHAQMQAPSTPEGRDGRSMPGATSNPNTGLPKSR
jgi:hypothetical protein